MNLYSLRLVPNRYSDAGIATRSYVTLYIITRHCLCVFGLVDASVGFRAFWLHLRFAGSHDRPTRQPCIGLTRILYVSAVVCGDQTVEAYSSCGLMKVLYAVDFSSCLCGLIFLLRKPNVWFAFFVMLAICVPQLRWSEMVTPRYLVADTLSSSAVKEVQCIWREWES